MGEGITDCDGSFRIVSERTDFRDFFDSRPDIYLKIYVRHSATTGPVEISRINTIIN